MSSTPASGVRPCGVPSSTRSAPASHSSTTRAATSSGVPGDAEALDRRRRPFLELERRIEVSDDVEVRLDGRSRPLSSPVSVLVDDADRADDDLHVGVVEPAPRDRHEVRVRATSELELVGDRPGPASRRRPPGADEQRYRVALARIRERGPGRERETLAGDARRRLPPEAPE